MMVMLAVFEQNSRCSNEKRLYRVVKDFFCYYKRTTQNVGDDNDWLWELSLPIQKRP